MSCIICLESDDVIKTCVCSNTAHVTCIEKWNSVSCGNSCCPYCKTPSKYVNRFNKDEIAKVLNDNEWSYIMCPAYKTLNIVDISGMFQIQQNESALKYILNKNDDIGFEPDQINDSLSTTIKHGLLILSCYLLIYYSWFRIFEYVIFGTNIQ